MMKTLFFLYFLFFTITFLTAKNLSFETYTHNLDEVIQGENRIASYDFINSTNQIITIEKIQPECDCLKVITPTPQTFAPNEKGSILISFNSNMSLGKVKKLAYIHTNEKSNPIIPISIKAVVTKSRTLSPPVIMFNQKMSKEKKYQTQIVELTIHPLALKHRIYPKITPPQIIQHDTSLFNISILLSASSEKNTEKYILVITPLKDFPSNFYKQYIKIKTHKGLSPVKILVIGQRADSIQLSSSFIDFGSSFPNRATKRVIKINNQFNAPLALNFESIKFKSTNFEVEHRKNAAFFSYALTQLPNHDAELSLFLTKPNDFEKGAIHGDILFTTNLPKKSQLKLKIFAILEGQKSQSTKISR